MSNNKKMLLKSDSKAYEKKDNLNAKEDDKFIESPIILKYIKNQVIISYYFFLNIIWVHLLIN